MNQIISLIVNILNKKITLIVLFLIIFILFFSLNRTLYSENNIDDVLKNEVSTEGYFDTKILNAIENENFDDVKMYQDLANFLHIKLTQVTINKIEKNNGFVSKSIRNAKEFGSGFIYGTGDSVVSVSGSILSDMTVVGDLRDLSTEGVKLTRGEKYDKVVFGIATLGVGLTASEFLTAGTSTPIKVGASVVKFAKKTKKLSKSFLKVISLKLGKAIDLKILKKVDFTNIKKIKKIIPTIGKSLKIKSIKKIFGNIDKLKKNTSIFDTVNILKYIDNEKDLSKTVKLSQKYKKNTRAVLKILGKGVLKGSFKVAKYTTLFVTQIVMIIFSFLVFIVALYMQIKWFRLILKNIKLVIGR